MSSFEILKLWKIVEGWVIKKEHLHMYDTETQWDWYKHWDVTSPVVLRF